MKNHILYIGILLIALWQNGQGQNSQQEYSSITINDYLSLVDNYHPLAQKADLLLDLASANNRFSRGGFDPKIEGGIDRKSFDGKNYFTLVGGAVKIPTWFGIELKADYNRSTGEFLNPSDFLPSRGLWSAGISIPLGKGLVIDERRTALKKAEIFEFQTEQERIIAYNTLMLESMTAYFQWQANYDIVEIVREGVALARQRFVATKTSFEQGDKPAIDTLESYIIWQTRENQLLEARIALENSKQQLENYLWLEGNIPLELTKTSRPEPLNINYLINSRDSLALLKDDIVERHPEIIGYDLKIDQLQIDRKLLREDLKPDLRINYNPLISTSQEDLFLPPDIANYKLGATFRYTILQRKERGKLQMNNIKIQEAQLDQDFKKQQIKNALDLLLENEKIFEDQISNMDQIVQDNFRLLQGELRKNEFGESSIFLINSRENKYLESQIKQIQLINKNLKNRLYFIYYTGQINRVLRV
jgi:outer membrane protein TolC